jgi:hypothetical protein
VVGHDAGGARSLPIRHPAFVSALSRRIGADPPLTSHPPEVAMSTRSYRLTLVFCSVAWFMLGLHTPMLHAWTSHGHAPSTPVVIVTSVLGIAAILALAVLFRAPGSSSQRVS